jgi:very-short-patch-repair endonuclease
MVPKREPHEPDGRVPRARKLRHDMTLAERKLWWHLRRLPLDGSHFRRQATIGPYFADFACHDLRLVVEIDGGQHSEDDQMIADATRTEFLNARGYQVLRFWNNEVLDNIDGVLSTIAAAIGANSQSPPPPTPPPRSASLRGRRGAEPQQLNKKNRETRRSSSQTSASDQ